MLAYNLSTSELQLLSDFIARNKEHLTDQLLGIILSLDAPVHVSAGLVISAECPGTRETASTSTLIEQVAESFQELFTAVFPTKEMGGLRPNRSRRVH